MFDRLARLTTHWPKTIVAVALMFIGLTLVYGSSVSKYLLDGGETSTTSQSAQAESLLDQKFPSGQPNYVMLVNAPQGVDDLWGSGTRPPALNWSFRRLAHIR